MNVHHSGGYARLQHIEFHEVLLVSESESEACPGSFIKLMRKNSFFSLTKATINGNGDFRAERYHVAGSAAALRPSCRSGLPFVRPGFLPWFSQDTVSRRRSL